jgi:hypothetical protein
MMQVVPRGQWDRHSGILSQATYAVRIRGASDATVNHKGTFMTLTTYHIGQELECGTVAIAP